VTQTAHASVGAALGAAKALHAAGHTALGDAVHDAATTAFFHGFSTANLVAGGVAAAGAIVALAWLPAQPGATAAVRREATGIASPAAPAAPAATAAVD
jgi:hypothetical protein